jgi:hypothetical protein
MTQQLRILTILSLSMLAGCATTPAHVAGAGTQLQTRQIQTRDYDTLDKQMTMRSVIATLQDLGFTIDQADAELGAVTATRLHDNARPVALSLSAPPRNSMRLTVTVVKRSDKRIAVRANARIGEKSVTNAETYQDFFVALDKAMFLTLHGVD